MTPCPRPRGGRGGRLSSACGCLLPSVLWQRSFQNQGRPCGEGWYPFSLPGWCQGGRAFHGRGGSQARPGRPLTPLLYPGLEQIWDFLPGGRPRLIHPWGFWGDIPAFGRPPFRMACRRGLFPVGPQGFCPENVTLGRGWGGYGKGVSSLG
jgi:hypothetical protein